jgi:hypothetical protein
MLTVHVEHYKERIHELVQERMQGVCLEAADSLADQYRRGLRENTAPPHSGVGDIPHAYLGHKEGGYPYWKNKSPLINTLNNTVEEGFARNQDNFLSTYIQAARGKSGGAVVGFLPSHVNNRFTNYLIGWDQGKQRGVVVARRPWVQPLYNRGRASIRDDIREFLKR